MMVVIVFMQHLQVLQKGYNYQVITFVNLDIPIFNKLLSVKNNGEPIFKGMLWVKGETSSVRGTVGANYLHGCG